MDWRINSLVFSGVVLAGVAMACGGPSAVTAPVSETKSSVSPYRVSQAQPPRAYESDSGIVLTMVYLERDEGAERKALARFVGVEHALAAKVFLVVNRKSKGNESIDLWETMFDGKYWPVMKNDHKTDTIEFSAPRSWTHMEVAFDRDASAAIDSAMFLAKHEKEKESLTVLASLDRDYHKLDVQKRGEKYARNIEQACGTQIPVDYVWDRYSDKLLLKPEVCMQGLSALEHVCKSSAKAGKTAVRKIKKIQCETGKRDSTSLDSEQGVLTIVASGKYQKVLDIKTKLASQLGIRKTVLRDTTGDYLVLDTLANGNAPIYWGKGPKLREVRSANSNTLVELDWPGHPTAIIRRSDHWKVDCRQTKRNFKELNAEESDKFLDSAEFGEPIWKRREVALARDNDGVYYYVDRASPHYGGKDYRVYRGLRGQMVQTKLYDIVDDAKGKVFSTDKGNLRLILTPKETGEAFWLQGKKREALTVISEFEPGYRRLIYRELGIYDGEELGLLCP